MIDLERLFKQSNTILFNDSTPNLPGVKDVLVSRLNLAKAINVTDATNSDFDSLIKSLEYSLQKSDELMALSIINRINGVIINITDSFDTISKIVNKKQK